MIRKNPEHRRLIDTDLSNWRTAPHSRWAFQNVRELIPTASIVSNKNSSPLPTNFQDLPELQSLSITNDGHLSALLTQSHTNSVVILHKGKKVWQWHDPLCDPNRSHIVFSVSKSITAILTGILSDLGIIDVTKPVLHYLPGARSSAYGDCTIQHLLDMTVALAFIEDYLNPNGDYYRYRNATCWNPVDQTQAGETLETFLYSLGKADFEHGDIFNYKSPNTDLLGLLLERAAGAPLAELLSTLLWKPMGAESDGYVTVDRATAARAAGGICVTADDLARFGQLILDGGSEGNKTIVPEHWIQDTLSGGDRTAWGKGDFVELLPHGCYRNQWYQIRNEDRCFMALGIHGQWLYINPTSQVVIVKLSAQPEPVDEGLDIQLLEVFEKLGRAY